jgi:flagellar motor switch protein FliN
MIREAQADYLNSLEAEQAGSQLLRACEDVLAGVADRKLALKVVSREAVQLSDLAVVDLNVLIEIQFERPKDVLHSVAILADAQELSALFALGGTEGGEILAADALLRLGDIISSFVDTLAGDLPWFQPAPRAWLANLDPIAPDPAGQLRCDMPPSLAEEPSLSSLRLEASGDGDLRLRLRVIIGEQTEKALLGLDGDVLAPAAAPPTAGPAPASLPVVAPVAHAPAAERTAVAYAASGPQANVQPVQFQQLGVDRGGGRASSIDLIRDVQLKVSVELGHASLTVREVLGLASGSVVELDRLAGEAVDVLVNDQLIARGEVVIVDESFGVRITEIVRGKQ